MRVGGWAGDVQGGEPGRAPARRGARGARVWPGGGYVGREGEEQVVNVRQRRECRAQDGLDDVGLLERVGDEEGEPCRVRRPERGALAEVLVQP